VRCEHRYARLDGGGCNTCDGRVGLRKEFKGSF
jgi:hypothetical protein